MFVFESRLGRSIDPNKEVKIYRNLHRSGPNGEPIYSVMQDGLVVGYVPQIVVFDGRFRVSEAGRDKVRRTGKKVVHAFVVGEPAPLWLYNPAMGRKARYNPYQTDTFVDHDGDPIYRAEVVFVGAEGIRYILEA